MNEYQIASIVGGVIAVGWFVAYVLCWLGQWAWAWVDDSEVGKRNWLASKINFSKWKYPVYLYSESFENGDKPHGYAKDKKYNNTKCGGLREGVDYKYGFNTYGGIISTTFITSLIPMFAVISFNLYPVTLAFLCVALIAWVARFSRRHKKLFDKHIVDKDAHK
jgi:hypothetical protein